MAAIAKTCPKCDAALTAEAGEPSRWVCEPCGLRFGAKPRKPEAVTAAPAPALVPSVKRESPPPARPSALPWLLLAGGGAAAFALLLLFGAVAVGLLLYARLARSASSPPTAIIAVAEAEEPPAPPAPAEVAPVERPKPEPAPIREAAPAPPATPKPDLPSAPPELKPTPEPVPPAAAAVPAPKSPVDRAIDRAVVYLKKQAAAAPVPNVAFPAGFGGGRQTGVMGLIGLALLESGVPADDPAVVACVSAVRQAGPACNATYEMAICIWFLDRLNDPKDEELIRDLAARLISGQLAGGKWTYTCSAGAKAGAMLPAVPGGQLPELTPDQLKELLDTLDKYDPSMEIPSKKRLAPVCHYVRGKKAEKTTSNNPLMAFGAGDLSLTQFAVLGLWVARRHHVPSDRSLLLAEAHVRSAQSSDGGWAYSGIAAMGTTDSMTCSGLLELAVGRAVGHVDDTKTENADPQFDKGLAYLADLFTRGVPANKAKDAPANAQQAQNLFAASGRLQLIAGPLRAHDATNQHALWLKDLKALQAELEKSLALDLPADARKEMQEADDQIKKYHDAPADQKKAEKTALENLMQQSSLFQQGAMPRGVGVFGGAGRLLKPGKFNRMNMDDFYCLWSLERLAVVCDLKTVDGTDWYAWGSDLLVNSQNEDGSWTGGGCGTDVDACLAVLFLKRVNVAKDLTAQLQRVAPIRDLSADKLKGVYHGETPSPGETTPKP